MDRLLAWLDERGCPVVLLDASEAGAPLYQQLGFVDEGTTLIFQHDDCALRPLQSERVAPLRPADIDELVMFDSAIFGADRRRVLAELLTMYPERGFVSRAAGGQIEGFLFAQRRNLGPWVAASPQAAEELLAAAMPLEFETDGGGQRAGPRVLAPGVNPAVAGMLLSYGFSPQRSLRHMRRGGSHHPGRRELLYGQTSLAIG
jgi:hypothetical protein